MNIVPSDINNIRLKIDHGFLVLEKAFTKDGVSHDIVVSDGDKYFQPGTYLDKGLKENIQSIFFACLNANAAAQHQNPPENAYYVYTKTPQGGAALTQTQAITAQGAPLEIGHYSAVGPHSSIDAMMANLKMSLDILVEFKTPPPQADGTGVTQQGTAQTGVSPQDTAPLSNPPLPSTLKSAVPTKVPKKKVSWLDSVLGGTSALRKPLISEQQLRELEAEQKRERRRQQKAGKLGGQLETVVEHNVNGHRLAAEAAQRSTYGNGSHGFRGFA